MSFAAWRDQQGFGPTAKKVLDLVVARGYNATPETFSIAGIAEAWRIGTATPPDVSIHILDGYDRVVQGIAAGVDIRLNAAVTRIRWADDGVEVQTAAGVFRARRAVITLPLAVLRAGMVAFDPPLPAAKQRAISGLAMQPALKVFLRFQQPFWDPGFSFLLGPDAPIPTFWTAPASGPVLVGLADGPETLALAALGEQGAVEQALAVLTQAFGPDPRRLFVAGRLVNWTADPWTQGGYSSQPPGALGLRKVLAAPVGALYWAGEAPSWTDDPGGVHTAITTGQLAAREILAGVGRLG
jgi:monoamine oxidase